MYLLILIGNLSSQYFFFFFLHFLETGTVVVHTSADEPVTAIPRLKLKQGGNPSVSVGHYRLSGDKVCFLILWQYWCGSYSEGRNNLVTASLSKWDLFHCHCPVVVCSYMYVGQGSLCSQPHFTWLWELAGRFHVLISPLWFLKQAQHNLHSSHLILPWTYRWPPT